ncbi:MAG: flagellar assembly protein FliX [Magnetospirillum sp. WYHS-4]
MKVSNVGSSGSVSGTRRTGKASAGRGSEFAEQLREAAGIAEAGGVVEGQAMVGVDSILLAQGMGDATEERQRRLARHYGEDLLERLEQIRSDLLAGAIPKERLMNLAQMMRSHKKRCNDPHLNAVIEEIELRVEVEIAKLTRHG